MCCSKLEHITEEAERCWIRFADELQRLHGLSDDSHTKLLARLADARRCRPRPVAPSVL
jgi:hypothetical protein